MAVLGIHGLNIKMEEANDFVVGSLLRGEVWETTMLELWIEECQKIKRKAGEKILDIGAYTGIYTLVAGVVSPHAKIDAYEPLKPVFDRLRHNIKLQFTGNRVQTEHNAIECFNMALSDYPDEGFNPQLYCSRSVKFQVTGGSPLPSGSSIEPHPDRPIIREFEVEMEKGDVIYEGTPIRLIKIDTERHEYHVIKGLEQTILHNHPTIFMEILDKQELDRIVPLMTSLGYPSPGLICEDLKEIVFDDRINSPKNHRTNYLFKVSP